MPTFDDLDGFTRGDPELGALFTTMQELLDRLMHLQPDLVVKAELRSQETFTDSGGSQAAIADEVANAWQKSFFKQPPGIFCNVNVEPEPGGNDPVNE